MGAVWFCCGIGLLMLFMYPRTLQWVGHATVGTHFDPFVMPDGTEVPYPNTPEFWSDLGPTTLGIMLIVEGITLVAGRHRGVLLTALTLVAICTMYNLGYVAGNIRQSIPILSFIALILGLPMTVDLFKRVRPRRRSQAPLT